MENQSSDWIAEIDRRAKIFEAATDDPEGRMTVADYVGIAVLVLSLTIGFWIWVA